MLYLCVGEKLMRTKVDEKILAVLIILPGQLGNLKTTKVKKKIVTKALREPTVTSDRQTLRQSYLSRTLQWKHLGFRAQENISLILVSTIVFITLLLKNVQRYELWMIYRRIFWHYPLLFWTDCTFSSGLAFLCLPISSSSMAAISLDAILKKSTVGNYWT